MAICPELGRAPGPGRGRPTLLPSSVQKRHPELLQEVWHGAACTAWREAGLIPVRRKVSAELESAAAEATLTVTDGTQLLLP